MTVYQYHARKVVQVFYVGVLIEEDILRAIHYLPFKSCFVRSLFAEKYNNADHCQVTWIRVSHQSHIEKIQKTRTRSTDYPI